MVDCDWLPEPTPPSPRMKMLPVPGPLPLKVTLGVYFSRSLKDTTFSWASCAPLIAWIVIGTSWRFSDRRCAVTTTSCSSLPVVELAVSAGAATTIAVPDALNMAATAAEIFGLGFIALLPEGWL